MDKRHRKTQPMVLSGGMPSLLACYYWQELFLHLRVLFSSSPSASLSLSSTLSQPLSPVSTKLCLEKRGLLAPLYPTVERLALATTAKLPGWASAPSCLNVSCSGGIGGTSLTSSWLSARCTYTSKVSCTRAISACLYVSNSHAFNFYLSGLRD